MSKTESPNWAEIQAKLREPFPAADIEWRIGRCGKGNQGPWAKALAYITNRAIMDRLDEVVGCLNWKNEKPEAGPQGGVISGISICGPLGVWITKWDGAENTQIEAVKGGLSDAMKRAAVQWGIGRYLYNLDEGWCDCSTTKKQGWRYQAGKQGSYEAFYWEPPVLPNWARPIEEQVTVDAPKKKYTSGDLAPVQAVMNKAEGAETLEDLTKLWDTHLQLINDSGKKKEVTEAFSLRRGFLEGLK